MMSCNHDNISRLCSLTQTDQKKIKSLWLKESTFADIQPASGRRDHGCFFSFPPLPQVYVDVPGGLNLSVSLPLVIGTIPLNTCASRTSSISSNCSTLSWLGLQERPEGVCGNTQTLLPPAHVEILLKGLTTFFFFFPFLFPLQLPRVTTTWQYQRQRGATACRAVIGLMWTEAIRDLCCHTSQSSDICRRHSTPRYTHAQPLIIGRGERKHLNTTAT